MDIRKKLPVGIESFEEIRTEEFYYVDKTGMIKELLYHWGKVNLFTRPRRFGKSLNMDMLKTFFEYGCDSTLFDGLKIMGEQELCRKYMGRFPVISITLKDIQARSYEGAAASLWSVLSSEARRFSCLGNSSHLTGEEKQQYSRLTQADSEFKGGEITSEETLKGSLFQLSKFLCRHYGQKVILLIDEYDVPLEKAYHAGYYDEMAGLLGNLLSRALKGNESLYFAVLTGCLRVAKESIFTGLNNFKIYSVSDIRFGEYFGFTDDEVRVMLAYYSFEESYPLLKEWYNGYQMGRADVYCPWDVINYIDLLRAEPEAVPRAFWINTSGNDIIRKFLNMAKQNTRREIECLIAGESISKKINQELTYRELYQNTENLWSVLYTTGYLTHRGKEGEIFRLVIPNQEIRKIFSEQIQEWFQEEIQKDTSRLDSFCSGFVQADEKEIERQFNFWLKKTISIRDTAVRKEQKENFYHGILLGLLSHREDWEIHSNAEAGEGYSDLLLKSEDDNLGIVIEVKYAPEGNLEAGCREALMQIEEKDYAAGLKNEGIEKILKYGIACYKKRCKVQMNS